ncbi:pentapeptide repeat-containing protein [Methanosarcina sp.]|uniref:pentapeptide repeat-containing protein n=1 Tax=Methanosarcina sp. TaxID=2213 RepID=UPI002ABACC4B|nr:pentapeptide repeat-containing protein [Methanosarcina sp.]MDY9926446.1 pentapeptide repeat-containing protein [Methanosarcina sp.]
MILKEELEQLHENAKEDARQLYEKVTEHPLNYLIFIITVIILVLLLIVLPYLQVNYHGINNATEKATLENQYRATLAQIIGGGAVLIGLYFAWGNLTNAREGQITERFTRAVEQLGDPKLEIRLGGVYALERIANESDKDYWPIMEILTAYVRKNSRCNDRLTIKSLKSKDVVMDIQANEYTKKVDPLERFLPLDIEAIVTVIGRRKYYFNFGEFNYLDLSFTYLFNALFAGAHLENTSFSGSNLDSCLLCGANVSRADLSNTNLKWASLEGANLKEAVLIGADLREADFREANLQKAFLLEADLREAENLTIDQLSKVKTLYHAKLDEELKIPLREKYPNLFKNPEDKT